MPRSRKILVVDDSHVIRDTLKAMLVKAGHRVIYAEDGQMAVQKTEDEKPDLVITDGLLPKMHGFLVCKKIKELPNPPKVVLLTGVYTKPTYKWEVKKEYGADDLLIKPVRSAELFACLEKQLADISSAEEAASAEFSEMIELMGSVETNVIENGISQNLEAVA